MPYKKLTNLIVQFKQEFQKVLSGVDVPDSLRKVPDKLAGTIGELLVIQELSKRGLGDLEYKSGQSSYDLFARGVNKKIEVRTSLLKNEGLYPKGIDFYGWRVKDRSQRTEKKFDILVCVALPKNFRKPKYYIFTHLEAFKVGDVQIGRFPNVQKKINIFKDQKAFEKAVRSKKRSFVTRYERHINRNIRRFRNAWDKLERSSA